jgi:poly-gamma-glutamate synthesis protein (capsule biosynthesis protein)
LVIASIHWGQEYANVPSAEQRSLARWLLENTEIDIISGNHVHAVQPIEFLQATNKKSGLAKEGLVIYAQGNFVSDQQTDKANKGIIVNISIEADPLLNKLNIREVRYLPTWVDETPGSGLKTYRVLNVEKALNDYREGREFFCFLGRSAKRDARLCF